MFSTAAVLIALSTSVGATPVVTVYGASWCGPCSTVKDFLKGQKVPFEYVDIDYDGGRELFAKASPQSGAIPFTVVGKDAVRGARLQALNTLLLQNKLVQGPRFVPPSDGERYGEYSALEWQQQFQALRQRVASLKARVARLEKEVVDVEGKATVIPRAKRDLKVATDSLDDLEKAASDVSLPRQYRAY